MTKPNSAAEELDEAATEWRCAGIKVRNAVTKIFPVGSVVRRTKTGIIAIVQVFNEMAPLSLGLLHENGNIWNEHVSYLEVVQEENWPEWVRREMRRRKKASHCSQ